MFRGHAPMFLLAVTRFQTNEPAQRVQTNSREVLLPGYVTVVNDGPGGGVDTKHGMVTLLLTKKRDEIKHVFG